MKQKEIKQLLQTPPKEWRAPWITFIKWSVWFLFGGSILVLLLCTARLLFRVVHFGPNRDFLSGLPFFGGVSLGEWCAAYAKGQVLLPIFVAMGLIHASFSLIVTVREKRMHGVRLQDAIQEVFPFLGWSYASYAWLILLGVYASGMDYRLTALICLFGALLGFSTPWIVTVFLTFGRHPQQSIVEYYLCYHKYPQQNKKSARDRTLTHIVTSARYINGYYTSARAVPINVALRTWQGFAVILTGTDLLSADSGFGKEGSDVTLGRIHGTTQLIIGVRAFWQYVLQDVPEQEWAVLIRQLLTAAVGCYCPPPENADQFFTASHRHKALPADHAQMILPLSGLLSYFRGLTEEYPSSSEYWDSWSQCFHYLYLISSVSPIDRFSYAVEGAGHAEKYDFSVRLLFLLMLAVLLGELSALEPNELDKLSHDPASEDLWILIERLSQVLHVSASWISRFLSWGLSIIFSYSADWFGSTRGILPLYDTYQWLGLIFDAVDSAGDDKEVT